MTLSNANHPEPGRLRAFAARRLAESELDAIAAHLSDCPACCALLDEFFADDGLLSRLQAAAQPGRVLVDGTERLQAVRAFKRHQGDSPSSMNDQTRIVAPGWLAERPRPTPTDVMPVGRCGEYELLAEAGRGGMGVVYQARHRTLQRYAAIKMVLSGSFASVTEHQRFRQEAELLARVQHPNIVQIYEVGENEGRPFLALEWVAGGSLAKRLDGWAWPPHQAAALIETLARAIHAAHQAGIIHRDLKPANVLLGQPTDLLSSPSEPELTPTLTAGPQPHSASLPLPVVGSPSALPVGHRLEELVPKIADFGLARLMEGGGVTQTGHVVGTPEYMAPEQASQKHGTIGPATDIHALGVLLYQLLVGMPPYRGGTPMEVIQAVLHADPVAPRRLQPHVPRDLEAIVLVCLEKHPAQRYASAWALAEDLQRFQQGRPVQARPIGPVRRLGRWCRRSPVVALLLGVLASVIVSSFCLVTWKWLEADQLRHVAENRAVRESQARQEAEERRQQGRQIVYVANVRLAQQAWRGGQIRHLLHLLDEAAERREGDTDLRGFEWDYLRRLAHPDARLLQGQWGQVMAVAYQPIPGDRTKVGWLASAGEDGKIRFWDLQKEKVIRTISAHQGVISRLAFSPDGQRIASAGHDNRVRVWNVADGSCRLTLDGHTQRVLGVAISPDGKWIASGSLDQTVRLWNATTGQLMHTLRGHTKGVQGVAFGPQPAGKQELLLASAGYDHTIRLWNVVQGTERLTLTGHNHWVNQLAFSPDGKALASTSEESLVRLWDVETGREIRRFAGHTGQVKSVAFSRDGQRLATASRDQTVRIWATATGAEVVSLKGHQDMVWDVVFHPDGRTVASAGEDGTVRLWPTATGRETFTIRGHRHEVWNVAFSPDGKRLASASVDGTVRIWDPDTGKQEWECLGHEGFVRALAYSPNGALLATGGRDHSVRLWEAATGKSLAVLRGHTDWVGALAFRPDGKQLASVSFDGKIRLWEMATGNVLAALECGTRLACVAYSPDGKSLAVGGFDREPRLWDMQNRNEIRRFQGHTREIWNLAFSPDGTQLATACLDHTVRLWDVESGKTLRILQGHAGPVNAVVFSPDGKRLATAGLDNAVKWWDAATGLELLSLKASMGWVNHLTMSPDGRRLALGGKDHTITLWEADRPDASVLRVRERQEQAFELVQHLFLTRVKRADVLAELKANALDAETRQSALALAERYLVVPGWLNRKSREVGRRTDATLAEYRHALLQAEEASRLEPANKPFVVTQALLRYRLGDNEAVVRMIGGKGESAEESPVELALLTKARYRLGQREEALKTLQRLREVLETPRWATDPECRGFWREAENLVKK